MGNFSRNGDSLYMSATYGGAGSWTGNGARTANKIDLSGYSKIASVMKYVNRTGYIAATMTYYPNAEIQATYDLDSSGIDTKWCYTTTTDKRLYCQSIIPEFMEGAPENYIKQGAIAGGSGERFGLKMAGTMAFYVYATIIVKADDFGKLAAIAGLPVPENLDALMADTAALKAIFENETAVKFMTSQCTGDFMVSVISDDMARSLLYSSTYYLQIQANEHWSKFISMVV